MDESEYRKNPSDQGALTDWRAQTDGQVRTQKESEQVRGTHRLESTDRQVKIQKNPSKQGALTNWRVWTDRQVRIQKESEQPRGTHFLESTDGWTSQDTERFQVTKGHSPTGEHRQTDKLGHGMNPSDQGALTNWRAQTDRQVRTWNESRQLRGTHFLESADR